MKSVPKSVNAFALEKRSVLIVVENEDFSFHQKSRTSAKIISGKFSHKTSNEQKPGLCEIEANDPGWFSSYE